MAIEAGGATSAWASVPSGPTLTRLAEQAAAEEEAVADDATGEGAEGAGGTPPRRDSLFRELEADGTCAGEASRSHPREAADRPAPLGRAQTEKLRPRLRANGGALQKRRLADVRRPARDAHAKGKATAKATTVPAATPDGDAILGGANPHGPAQSGGAAAGPGVMAVLMA